MSISQGVKLGSFKDFKFSLVIPAYNEEKRIKETLEAYRIEFYDLGINFEIIVEMDGCTDRTAEIVRGLAAKFPEIKFIEFKKKLGKGGGLLKGFEVASGDVVGFVDADGSVQPREFIKLLTEIKNGYDGVIASRRAEGAIVIGQPPLFS
jgi:glycosyltransferase involved in cell wall biosynthesis